MGRPISDKHAIEVAAFVISFERPFSSTVIDALMTLKDTMCDDYPAFSTSNVIKMRLDSKGPEPTQDAVVAGVVLKKLNQAGRPSWSLRADSNSIVVSCSDYQTWKKTSPKALADLTTVASVAADDQNPLAVVAFQVVDRFVGPSQSGYKLNQVFNTRSKFFTKQTIESGPLWHVHQGWFQEQEFFEGKLLNVLNLSTNEVPEGIITTIDHTARLQLIPAKPAIDATNKDFLRSIFDTLHGNNKDIVTDLLNAKQRKAIDI